MEDQKRIISFKDANNIRFEITLKLTHRNGYPEFTACGEGGQCQGEIAPDNEHQEKLLEYWAEYHLNGMNAGTEKQKAVIKNKNLDFNQACDHLRSIKSNGELLTMLEHNEMEKSYSEKLAKYEEFKRDLETDIKNLSTRDDRWRIINSDILDELLIVNVKKSDYHSNTRKLWVVSSTWQGANKMTTKSIVKATTILKSLKPLQYEGTLYVDVHPDTGEPYTYGSEWLTSKLPDNFWDDIEELCDDIETAEAEKRDSISVSDLYDDSDISDFDLDEYDDHVIALAIHLELSISEIDDIEESCNGYGNCSYTCQGADYYCGDSEEIDKAKDESVESYIEECVMCEIPEYIQNFLDKDKMIEYYGQDGWEHCLNHYDGNGHELVINETTYFICRT